MEPTWFKQESITEVGTFASRFQQHPYRNQARFEQMACMMGSGRRSPTSKRWMQLQLDYRQNRVSCKNAVQKLLRWIGESP